jgi:hypothetical protein
MLPRSPTVALLIICAIGILQPSVVEAQWRNLSRGTRLTKQDMDALSAASKQLLDRPQVSDGAFAVWNNPASGASGSIVAGEAVTRNGLACRQLTYFTTVVGPGPRPNRTTDVVWCKTETGWKLG